MANEARAASLTLTVLSGSTTIYTTTGGATKVTADINALNAALVGAGLGGYTFSSLGGSSNNPGTSGPAGGYIITGGTLDVTTGGAGAGTPLKIVLTEGGFTSPSSGALESLSDTATSNYAGVVAGSTQTNVGNFVDSSVVNMSTPPITHTFAGKPGFSTTSLMGLPSYVTAYTLTSTMTVSLTADPSGTKGSDGFTDQVTVSSIPEPASLVLMLTGMPLPLVVLGLLRRHRAAA
jgi:hypothetical protein